MVMINKRNVSHYESQLFYDEMFDADGEVRAHYEKVYRQYNRLTVSELDARQEAMHRRMLKEGVTFTLYEQGQHNPVERTIPFDLIPRIIPSSEWDLIEKGLRQRTEVLNLFLHDIYHEQNIMRDGIIPRKMIISNCYFRPEMMNLDIPNNVYTHAAGIDLIRDETGRLMVLEDNLRCPSGFSYLFKSRSLMANLFPKLYFAHSVRDVEQGLNLFLSALRSMAPSGKADPVIALLTPGVYNSAYYEHTFLAQQMGIELVEGRDLIYKDHKVYIRGIREMKQVDVLYRRIDDHYLDPIAFQPDSVLGVAGLMNAYRAGNIAIVNAPGTGVADDKAIYAYVPEMIRYYLNQEPILHNVPTFLMDRREEREYVLANLSQMVVKETSLSGGYGMLIGSKATEEELIRFAEKIQKHPNQYIAQHTIKLSTAPIVKEGRLEPRHIDLRAFVIMGEKMDVIPGGLTRVALKEGSLVVNSSQGGGCKDTWILQPNS
jgi:uncharacterized circularly permuted ATP-grasp superfamily protein